MLFSKFEQMRAALERPVAPWGDDFDVRVQRIGRKLEANLVVALAGRAVRDGVGAGLFGDFDQVLGDQRAGNRGAEQIDAFIDGIGAEHRENEIAHEFFAHVLDEDFLDAQHFRFLAGWLKFFALTEIGSEGHNFRAEFCLKPLQDDRGVEAARIGENDFLNVFPLAHNKLPSHQALQIGAQNLSVVLLAVAKQRASRRAATYRENSCGLRDLWFANFINNEIAVANTKPRPGRTPFGNMGGGKMPVERSTVAPHLLHMDETRFENICGIAIVHTAILRPTGGDHALHGFTRFGEVFRRQADGPYDQQHFCLHSTVSFARKLF